MTFPVRRASGDRIASQRVYYEDHGFREVARIPFNEDFAQEDWDVETDGRPDVVFMAYAPDTPPGPVDRYFDDDEWDAAKELSREEATT